MPVLYLQYAFCIFVFLFALSVVPSLFYYVRDKPFGLVFVTTSICTFVGVRAFLIASDIRAQIRYLLNRRASKK